MSWLTLKDSTLSDFCDSTIFGECATDSFDGTFSNSDPAPTIDIMFHILKGLE